MRTYLILRGGTYHFRYQLPKRYHSIIGCKVIKRSLGTGRKRIGKAKANILACGIIAFLRKFDSTEDKMVKVNSSDVKRMLLEYMEQLLEEDNSNRAIPRNPLPGWEHASGSVINRSILHTGNQLYKEELNITLANQDYEWIISPLNRFIREYNIDVEPESPDYYVLAREMCKILNDTYSILIMRHDGDQIGERKHKLEIYEELRNYNDFLPQVESGIKLGEAVEKYIQDKTESNAWRKSSLKDIQPQVREFARFVGPDIHVGKITRDNMRSYRSRRESLPSNKHMLHYKGLDEETLLGMDIPDDHKLATKSLETRYTNVRTFLNWLQDEGLITNSKPLNSVLTIKKTDPRKARLHFTDEELKALFCNDFYFKGALEKDKSDKAWKFWTPIMCLFTGARVEELCQLYLDDFKSEDGIYYIDINTEEDKQTKTPASNRKIPIHPFMIEIGLMSRVDHLRSIGERFFLDRNTLSSSGKLSANTSKWFTRFRRKCGVGAGQGITSKQVLHSFRHTLATWAYHRGVHDGIIQQTIGHLDNHRITVTDIYKGDFSIKQIYDDFIVKIDFHDRIGLHHLVNNDWIYNY